MLTKYQIIVSLLLLLYLYILQIAFYDTIKYLYILEKIRGRIVHRSNGIDYELKYNLLINLLAF